MSTERENNATATGRNSGKTAKVTGKRREYGEGGIQRMPGSRFWYISYRVHGKQVRESTRSESREYAKALLRKRLEEVAKGANPSHRNLRYEDLRALLISDYRLRGNRTLVEMTQDGKKVLTICGLLALDKYFKCWKVSEISTDSLRKFIQHRLDVGVQPATVNRSLALLRRMLNLAHQQASIQTVIYFPFCKEADPRQGFVEQQHFDEIRKNLPVHLVPLFLYLYESGTRFGEARQIEWSMVDLDAGLISLPGRITKNKQPRIVPLTDELITILKKVFRNEPTVFSTVNYRKDWHKARKAAGFPALLIHDLRRSAVRNFVRSGTDRSVAKKISGHLTDAIFDRYNITSVKDIKEAMTRKVEQSLNKSGSTGGAKSA